MSTKDPMHARNPLDWIGKRYLGWTAYGLMLMAAALIQFTPHLLEIGGAKPMLLLPLVVSVALFTGPAGGAAMGAFAGFLWDMYAGKLLGLYGLLLFLIGCAGGLLAWLLIRNNVFSAWALSAGATLLYTLAAWGLTYWLLQKERPFWVLWAYYLPDFLYTALTAPLVYMAVRAVARLLRRRR